MMMMIGKNEHIYSTLLSATFHSSLGGNYCMSKHCTCTVHVLYPFQTFLIHEAVLSVTIVKCQDIYKHVRRRTTHGFCMDRSRASCSFRVISWDGNYAVAELASLLSQRRWCTVHVLFPADHRNFQLWICILSDL